MAEQQQQTVDTGARPAEQQGGNNPPVNPKELLSQLEPEYRNIAQSAINAVAKKLEDGFQQKHGTLAQELAEARAEIASFKEFRQGLEESFGGDEETPPDILTEIEKQLTPPPWVKGAEQRRLWQDMARRDYLREQSFKVLTDSDENNRKTIADLQKQIEADRTKSKELTESRSAALRRADLAGYTAMSADPQVFIRYHKDNIVTDPQTGMSMYQEDDGTLLDLKAGLEKHTPDLLRKPILENGGSGARGARAVDPEAAIKAAEQEMFEAQKRASETQTTTDVSHFQAAQRKLKQLKQAAQAA